MSDKLLHEALGWCAFALIVATGSIAVLHLGAWVQG